MRYLLDANLSPSIAADLVDNGLDAADPDLCGSEVNDAFSDRVDGG